VIQSFANGFATNMSTVTLTIDNAAVDIGKAAVVFLVVAGALLWFTRVNKHLGKELLEGGIIIGLFIEFAVPMLMSIHY
jgi:2-keto-4-pentenoate hydratase